MEPKERAEKLYEKFADIILCKNFSSGQKDKLKKDYEYFHFPVDEVMVDTWNKVYTPMIKQCTLVFCDEMLENISFIWEKSDPETEDTARDKYRNYWNEVKSEIEKL